MSKYLGETIVDVENNVDFKDFTPADWAMYFIARYGQIDGDHHKAWVLDQVAKILKGSKVIVKLATWDNGEREYRVTLDEPSAEYKEWVSKMMGEYNSDDGCYEYDYEHGIAP